MNFNHQKPFQWFTVWNTAQHPANQLKVDAYFQKNRKAVLNKRFFNVTKMLSCRVGSRYKIQTFDSNITAVVLSYIQQYGQWIYMNGSCIDVVNTAWQLTQSADKNCTNLLGVNIMWHVLPVSMGWIVSFAEQCSRVHHEHTTRCCYIPEVDTYFVNGICINVILCVNNWCH